MNNIDNVQSTLLKDMQNDEDQDMEYVILKHIELKNRQYMDAFVLKIGNPEDQLTGYARCITFSETQEFVTMTEGKMESGFLNGFGRKLDCNGECQFGHWEKKEMKVGKK